MNDKPKKIKKSKAEHKALSDYLKSLGVKAADLEGLIGKDETVFTQEEIDANIVSYAKVAKKAGH
jgi:hypothetical protein